MNYPKDCLEVVVIHFLITYSEMQYLPPSELHNNGVDKGKFNTIFLKLAKSGCPANNSKNSTA